MIHSTAIDQHHVYHIYPKESPYKYLDIKETAQINHKSRRAKSKRNIGEKKRSASLTSTNKVTAINDWLSHYHFGLWYYQMASKSTGAFMKTRKLMTYCIKNIEVRVAWGS